MRYVEARQKKEQREETYRIFVTEALRAIVNNTSTYLGCNDFIEHGVKMETSFNDILNPPEETKPDPAEDEKDCDEIVADIWKNLKGRR